MTRNAGMDRRGFLAGAGAAAGALVSPAAVSPAGPQEQFPAGAVSGSVTVQFPLHSTTEGYANLWVWQQPLFNRAGILNPYLRLHIQYSH